MSPNTTYLYEFDFIECYVRDFHPSLHRTFFIVLCSVKVLVSRHCETQSCDGLHTCIWCFGLLHRNKVLCHMAATITGTTTEEVLSASSVFICLCVDRLSPWWQHILQDTVVKLTRCVVEIKMTAQSKHGCRPACNNEYWAFNSWNVSWCNVFEHGLYFDWTVSLNVHWGKLVLLSGQGIRDCVHSHRCCHRTRGKWWVRGCADYNTKQWHSRVVIHTDILSLQYLYLQLSLILLIGTGSIWIKWSHIEDLNGYFLIWKNIRS